MKVVCLLFLTSCSFISMAVTQGYVPPPSSDKLQISVRRSVSHCTVKSRTGDILHIYYTGFLEDGTEFDQVHVPDVPFKFTLGAGQVIRGWDQGMRAMCEGEQRVLMVPPDMAHGNAGSPPKFPKSVNLIFYVELLKIERHDEL